jgi:hypothetical protein
VPRRERKRVTPRETALRFTPTAWAKLLFFCHYGDTEIGGFGISDPADLLLIRDFRSIHQVVSSVTVSFDDVAVADFYDEQVALGRQPREFSRIWLHTHPGESPTPSHTDEETFDRVFGDCDWAVMAILAKGGRTYARLRFHAGPGASLIIPVQVDYCQEFQASDWASWQEEYLLHVHPVPLAFVPAPREKLNRGNGHGLDPESRAIGRERQKLFEEIDLPDDLRWWEPPDSFS